MKKRRLIELKPLWVVGPECDCISVTPVQYVDGSFSQWGLQINCIKRPSFLIISPLIIKVKDELSIGTNAREPIIKDVLDEVLGHFQGTKPEGCFHSGPVDGIFLHSKYDLAWQCLKRDEGEYNPQWHNHTKQVVDELRNTFGMPYLEFRTYEEVRVHCG